MSDLKTMVRRVQPEDDEYGIHGARVEGYNAAKKACGEEMAVAHGGWKPGSNSKYDRFPLPSVFAMASRMAAATGESETADDDAEAEVAVGSSPPVLVRSSEPRVVGPQERRARHTSSGAAAVLNPLPTVEEEPVGEVIRGEEARTAVSAAVLAAVASPPMRPSPRLRSPRRTSPPRLRSAQ